MTLSQYRKLKLKPERLYFTIVSQRRQSHKEKKKPREVPTDLQPNGLPRQNHSWLSTLVSMTTEEALAMVLL